MKSSIINTLEQGDVVDVIFEAKYLELIGVALPMTVHHVAVAHGRIAPFVDVDKRVAIRAFLLPERLQDSLPARGKPHPFRPIAERIS
jgi:hypothetical protein